jgi:cell wall-associated NlpC family hydrolase
MDFDKYIGIPFEKLDCYRFVQWVLNDAANIRVPSFDTIGTEDNRRIYLNFLNEISSNWESVKQPQQFDVVAMAYDAKHPKLVQHFGVYIGDGLMLHTLKHIGSHSIKLEHPAVKSSIQGIYRWNLM